MEISFKQFQEFDLRVGKVLTAEVVPGSRSLIKMQIYFGSEQRQCVAGISQHYKPEQLVGNKYMFIVNLEKKRMMGVESQCMIFAAEDGDNIVLMKPEKDVKEGSKIH